MFSGPGHVLWTRPYLFPTWGHEKCVGRACVFSAPCGDIFFLDLHVFVLDPGIFVSSPKLFGFCFLDPCTCFVDLGSIGWGGTPLLYALTLGLMFLDLGAFFLPAHVFFDMAQGGGNLDIEPRCMQEVVDGGEVRILKQHKCKKRWRGRRGGSLRMKRHGCKKLRGTWGEEKVRYWNKMSATSCWEMRDEA